MIVKNYSPQDLKKIVLKTSHKSLIWPSIDLQTIRKLFPRVKSIENPNYRRKLR